MATSLWDLAHSVLAYAKCEEVRAAAAGRGREGRVSRTGRGGDTQAARGEDGGRRAADRRTRTRKCLQAEAAAEEPEAEAEEEAKPDIVVKTAPFDPRFPTMNQTKHCYTRYNEYHKCLKEKGDDCEDCQFYARAYRTLCPGEWVEKVRSALAVDAAHLRSSSARHRWSAHTHIPTRQHTNSGTRNARTETSRANTRRTRSQPEKSAVRRVSARCA